MTDNDNFQTPVPSIAEVATARGAFEQALQAAMSGGKELTAIKNEKKAVLTGVLRNLGRYVDFICKGDGVKILSSGFDIQAEREPLGTLPAPAFIKANVAGTPGEIKLRWGAVKGAGSYNIEISSDNPDEAANWKLLSTSVKASAVVSELTTGAVYWFRVYAVGASGNGDISNPATSVAP